MKKLLSMVLAMLLICTSMGVLATGETPVGNNSTLVWAWDFEETNVGLVGSEAYPKTQVEGAFGGGPAANNSLFYWIASNMQGGVISAETVETEGFEAASGTHAMEIGQYTQKFTTTMTTPHVIPLEKDTWYKFSYKYAVASTHGAVVVLGVKDANGTTETFYNSADANWAAWAGSPNPSDSSGEGFSTIESYFLCAACEKDLGTTKPDICTNPDCQAKLAADDATVAKTRFSKLAWNAYEIYFKSKNVDTQTFIMSLGKGKGAGKTFYDDLKLEKVTGSTDVLFSTKGPGASVYETLITKNQNIVGRNVGTKDDVNIVAYPFCILRKPALEMNGTNVTVSVAHVPEKEEETIQLLIGQYKMVDGKAQLLDIWSKPVTFTAATKKDATNNVTEYYYAENALQLGMNLTGLENVTDSYLQAFVMDEISGLRPIGGKAVLAPAAVTPAA